jgi:hypothetical protein
LFLGFGLALSAQASWFGSSHSEPPYKTWSASQLTAWLEAHDISIPKNYETDLRELVQRHWPLVSDWSYDQYTSAQKVFTDVQNTAFDKWDESHLREFLLKQGIVAPKSRKEELIQLAKSQYRGYTNAASAYATPTISAASETLSSIASRVTTGVVRTLDDTKDYVYSTWDDNQLRAYLESKGIQVKAQAHKSRNDLLSMMREAYATVAQPVWDAWSDSYIHEWLVAHGILSPKPPTPYTREYLLRKMSEYYYDANDTVYSTWSESLLREWLIKNGIIKSDAQIKRDKLLKLVEDNYLSAKSTALDSWSDSQVRQWLVEHKYIDDRTAAGKKRDELIELMRDKYHSTTSAPYLAWPDARLRAYLRQHGLPEDMLPTQRPGLLQEVRIRWVQSQTLWDKVKEIVLNVEETVEWKLSHLWAVLRGEGHVYENMKRAAGETYGQVKEKYDQGKRSATEKSEEARESAEEGYEEGKKTAGEKYAGAKGAAGETYKSVSDTLGDQYDRAKATAGGMYDRARGTAEEKYDQAGKEAGRKYTEAEKAYEAGKERAYEKVQEGREYAGEKAKTGGEKLKASGSKIKGEDEL